MIQVAYIVWYDDCCLCLNERLEWLELLSSCFLWKDHLTFSWARLLSFISVAKFNRIKYLTWKMQNKKNYNLTLQFSTRKYWYNLEKKLLIFHDYKNKQVGFCFEWKLILVRGMIYNPLRSKNDMVDPLSKYEYIQK